MPPPEHDALLQACQEMPWDAATLLVYADWLDEHQALPLVAIAARWMARRRRWPFYRDDVSTWHWLWVKEGKRVVLPKVVKRLTRTVPSCRLPRHLTDLPQPMSQGGYQGFRSWLSAAIWLGDRLLACRQACALDPRNP